MSEYKPLNEFEEFPKLYRLMRDIVITEKLDGTNAQIAIDEHGSIRAGSRNRWLTPDADNYGFARWVHEHRDELMQLGVGRHFGEWWGGNVQKRYGKAAPEKRFTLFNTHKWNHTEAKLGTLPHVPCVSIVPVLYRGVFSEQAIAATLARLGSEGSVAAPGCMNPEGIVVYHVPANVAFKITLGGDGHKGNGS